MIKKFESFGDKYLKTEDIEDIFIDFIHHDFYISFFDKGVSEIGKYYFRIVKNYSEDYFEYIDKGHAYGNIDLKNIRKEIDKSFDILEETKNILNSMNYSIAYELEMDFSSGSYINITCHMQHKKHDSEY